MHIKFHSSPLKSGDNSGSCGALLNYLEKEDKDRTDEDELKGFFNAKRSDLTNDEAKQEIEHQFYKKGLRANADKFYTVTMSFSEKELEGKTNAELMKFAQDRFGQMYSNAMHGKKLDPEQVKWVAKLEENRTYKGFDDIPEGKKQGDAKEGDNRHIHFVVARKTADGKRQVSPMTTHKHKTDSEKAVIKSGFDQDHFKFECEEKFDHDLKHGREKEDSIHYHLGGHRPDLTQKFDRTKAERYKESKEDLKEMLNEFHLVQKENQQQFEKVEREHSKWQKLKDYFNQLYRKVTRGTGVKKSVEDIDKGSTMERLKQMEQQKENERKQRDKGNDKEMEL
jgi:hypothetical protein